MTAAAEKIEPLKSAVRKSFGSDLYLLTMVVLLLTIGIVMVTSASYIIAADKYGDGFYFVKKQGWAMLLGLGVMYVLSRINPNFWMKAALPLMVISVFLLLMVFIPGIGAKMGGSNRWLRLPFGFYLQPSEVIKYALIMFTAQSLARKGDNIREFAIGILPHVIVVGAVVFLILLQPDFGSAIILTLVTFMMLFIAGVRLQHLAASLILGLPVLAYIAINAPYRWHRIKSFFDPWSDPLDSGYHVIQSLLAFGCGGVTGVGVGKGIQKLFYLPQPHTDFIFAVVGEELGLVGIVFVIICFYLLVFRGLMVAVRTTDKFQKFVAFGISSLLGLQAIVNMAVSMGMLPTKGLPLPLISLGGTSLVMNLAGIGILMAIMRFSQTQAEQEALK